jgi:3-dehydroquinate dehydratase-2
MDAMPKILVIQGANMNWLGKRQPEHYGSTSAAELDEMIRRHAQAKGYEVDIFYTNTEGAAIDRIYQAVEAGVDALVMNPAGFTFNDTPWPTRSGARRSLTWRSMCPTSTPGTRRT